MQYKHLNIKTGIITISDSKGQTYVLRPNEQVTIDREATEARPNGIVCIERLSKSKGLDCSPTSVGQAADNEEKRIEPQKVAVTEKTIKKNKEGFR